jgi:alpha-1,6-mannosyltransferase
VPGAVAGGPDWLLGVYGDGLGVGGGAYYGFLWLAFLSYLAVLWASPALDGRLLAASVVLVVVAFALAPPLLSQDVFSYISYARLGVEHGLNPYLHPPSDYAGDPAFIHVGWRDAVSAYGPLFTLSTYPLALLPLPAALWAFKALAAGSVLALAGLCARVAPARGVDPRRAAVVVGLNPLVLVHVVGGAHNDGLMMFLLLAGCAAVLALRELTAGGAIVAAVAVKVSAVFAAPFAILGAKRRGRLGAAALAATALVAAAGLVAFGPHALDAVGLAGENQAKASHYSVPSTVARILGVGTEPVRIGAIVLYAALIVWLLGWTLRGADWLRAAGWAAFGLLMASSWLLPWYLIWALPFAALSRDRTLIGLVLALTAFQLVNRVPL